MKVSFLLDENVSPRVKATLLRLSPQVDVLRVGDPATPSLGTPDPELLRYLELSQRMLITRNRASMPAHLEEHRAAGGHFWGLHWIRPSATIGRVAEDLSLIWEASEAEEWVDRVGWIPF